MSEPNFNNLPPELKIKIFRFLDKGSLKNAMLTCKLWNDIIESTYRWKLILFSDYYGKLISVYSDSAEHNMNFLLTTNRKFGTIEIGDIRFSQDNQILNILQRHGFNVVRLILHGAHVDSFVTFSKLLNLTPNLKHAVIRIRGTFGTSDVLDEDLPDLVKLKSLELIVDDYRIAKCFGKAKLTTVKILDYGDSEHYDSLVDILSSQAMLKSLALDVHYESPSLLAAFGKLSVTIPFQLTKLAIEVHRQMSSHDQDNLLRFVKSQTKYIKEMEMGSGIPTSVYDCVFGSTAELNSLSAFVRPDVFNARFNQNCSIRTIKLMDYGLNDMSFLRKLPNISSLILEDSGYKNKNAFVMAQNLSKLESLTISSIDDRSIGYVKLPNLKTLQIEFLSGKINWNEFTKIHSRLTELTIEFVTSESFLISDDIDQIVTNVDLQKIRLGYGFVADDRFFEIIRTKCTNLKVLDLHKSCISLSHGLRNKVESSVQLCDVIERSDAFPSMF